MAPCSASPSTRARRHGSIRSNAAHSARTNPSIEPTAHAAVASSHIGSALSSRARTSPTPGSVDTATTTTTATTAKKAARLPAAAKSSPACAGVAAHACAGRVSALTKSSSWRVVQHS